jgi:hypothetical protein
MKELVEFKTPAFLLVVNYATCLVLRDAHIDVLHGIINIPSNKNEVALTLVEGSIWRFLEAKLAVGLERMTTLTLCFTMIVFILMIYS